MEVNVGSEGMGVWGAPILLPLLQHLFPKRSISFPASENLHLMVRSKFKGTEPYLSKKPLPGIYWAGEIKGPSFSKNLEPTISITASRTPFGTNHFYIPMAVYSPFIYRERCPPVEKEYSTAYCYRRWVWQRERAYNLSVKINGAKNCRALGQRCGWHKNTRQKIAGAWWSDELIEQYRKARFVIAFENSHSPGYVTEKIVNALYAGCIPIYSGDSEVSEFFNAECFLNVDNFDSLESCIRYASKMSEDEYRHRTSLPFLNPDNKIINILNPDKKYEDYRRQVFDLMGGVLFPELGNDDLLKKNFGASGKT